MKYLLFFNLLILPSVIGAQDGWFTQNSHTTSHLNSVYFMNDRIGWAVGSEGVILKTINGGENWSAQKSGTSAWLMDVDFINSAMGWVVGSDGVILKTSNGGEDWIRQDSGITNWCRSVDFVDSTFGVIVAWERILRTIDGGKNWISRNAGHLESVCFINRRIGWAVGMSGSILKTNDGGMNWISQYSEYFSWHRSVFFTDSCTGWVVGIDRTILKTTTGGTEWIPIKKANTNEMESVHFTDKNNGWVVGEDSLNRGIILKTNNGGINWSYQHIGKKTDSSLRAVYFISANTGWAVGGHGLILKTTTGGVTLVDHQDNPAIDNKNPFVNLLNYPNPFNALTIICYNLSNAAFIRLKIYDITGKEIKTLIEGYQTIGEYEIKWDATTFANGIYFCRLSADGLFQTKKLILIK